MWWVFFVCAVAGTTVFVVQFLLSLVGFGAEHVDFDFDLPHDFEGHVATPEGAAWDGNIPDHVHASDAGAHGHGSTRLFGMISVRTVTAAVAFFGLGGLGMSAAGRPPFAALGAALGSGFLAMYAVHWVMRQLARLRHDGTFRIGSVVGRTGNVYLPIPGNGSGKGKVQVRTPGGIVECAAVTAASDDLPAGRLVEIVRVVGSRTVEVRPRETEDA